METLTRDFTAHIRRDFAQEITSDPKTFKKSLLKLIGRQLPPRRGRPNDPRLDVAVRMVERGKTVKEVLRMQIPDFDKLDTFGRYLVEKGLRAAIARRRKHSRNTPHPTNVV